MSDVDRNKIWVFDCETDNLNESNRAFSASPYYSENDVVNSGWCVVEIDSATGDTDKVIGVFGQSRHTAPDDVSRSVLEDMDYYPWLLCGHNVRYDLQFLRKDDADDEGEDPLVTAVKCGATTLWDTQFAEYLLSGHKEKMISLNKLAEKYGFEPKLDEVKEMWDSGYKTRDIDGEMLDDYVEQDVKITTDIALRQIALAYEYEMLDFILVQMRSLFVVSEYEWNGMYVDRTKLVELEHTARKAAASNRHWAFQFCTNYLEDVDLCNELVLNSELNGSTAVAVIDEWFDIESVDKLKRLFFGGEFKIKYPVEVGTYKTGKKKGEPKYQNKEFTYPLPTVVDPDTMPDAYLTPTGLKSRQAGKELTFKDVSLDDSTIEFLSKPPGIGIPDLNDMLNHIRAYRDNKKLETTYCKAVADYLFEDDGCLHGNLNVDNSATGRLTSSNPNMQNMPSKDDSEFKDVFTSRFENGRIGAVDFKQLEVVGLAHLSGDEQLIDDLMNGRDIHTETGREAGLVSPIGMSHDTRRNIKSIVFGCIYGGGVKKLTLQSGFEEKDVKRCIDALKKRYPKAFGRQYIHDIEEKLDLLAERLDRDDSGKRRFGNFIYQPTRRRIWLETAPSKDYVTGELEQQWPYTKMRNYPVQSIAADIVSIARILFYDTIHEYGMHYDIFMINEVHDEIVFDMTERGQRVFRSIVDEVERKLPLGLKQKFNLDKPFDLPLVLETGVGKTWREAK